LKVSRFLSRSAAMMSMMTYPLVASTSLLAECVRECVRCLVSLLLVLTCSWNASQLRVDSLFLSLRLTLESVGVGASTSPAALGFSLVMCWLMPIDILRLRLLPAEPLELALDLARGLRFKPCELVEQARPRFWPNVPIFYSLKSACLLSSSDATSEITGVLSVWRWFILPAGTVSRFLSFPPVSVFYGLEVDLSKDNFGILCCTEPCLIIGSGFTSSFFFTTD